MDGFELLGFPMSCVFILSNIVCVVGPLGHAFGTVLVIDDFELGSKTGWMHET